MSGITTVVDSVGVTVAEWHVTDDAVGMKSGRKFLSVTRDLPNLKGEFVSFNIATTGYCDEFTKEQHECAKRLAEALNDMERHWLQDDYHTRYGGRYDRR